MDVARARDRARVPEAAGDLVDRGDDVPPALSLAVERAGPRERARREDGARPGTEVLRREVVSRDLAEVRVHVVGIDRVRRAISVGVLEEVLSRQLVELVDDARETAVGHVDLVGDTALAPEPETDLRPSDRDVVVSQRRQSERAVPLRVLVVADPDESLLEQPDDRRQYPLARETGAPEVRRDPPADARQGAREVEEAGVLGRVARLAPPVVVAVLLPPSRIPAGRLHVVLLVG